MCKSYLLLAGFAVLKCYEQQRYSMSKYYKPIWGGHLDTDLDIQLNGAGTLKSILLPWFSVLTDIFELSGDSWLCCMSTRKLSLTKSSRFMTTLFTCLTLDLMPPTFWAAEKAFFFFSSSSFNSEYTGCLQWAVSDVNNQHLIDDPTIELPGFLFHQRQWMTINCIRIFHGRCAHPMHKWRIEDLPQCECGDLQTIKHIVNNCFVF